ncbi:MAG: hypothetical protein B6I28_02590 [Fusobacteriia bacterium 4572_132]|nr:MAG: hypothetical protein B6I28_02590 [Fusobacteriia bacterium 4572_132]
MKTIYVKKTLIAGKKILVKDRGEINHIKNVFRMKENDKLRVIDGEKEYITIIKVIENKNMELEVKEEIKTNNKSEVKIDIALTMIKKDNMNLSIKKLTEIGIDKIIPLKTKRTVIKLDKKNPRWDKISIEALKQCQGVTLVEITDPKNINDLLLEEYDLVLVPYAKQKSFKLKEIKKEKYKKILYIIGPEGGFTEKEIEMLEKKGGILITLGERILRAETAAIVVGGYLINEFR